MAKVKTHKVHPALWPLLTPIGDVTPDPKNAKSHGARSITEIAASLERFGMDQPLIAEVGSGIVRIGNGRLMAARSLGWTHVAAVMRDESEIEMIARGLIDNRSAEFAEWDNRNLSELILDVQRIDPTLLMGWTAEEQAAIHLMTMPAPMPAPPDPPAMPSSAAKHHKCPNCSHEWET